MSTCDLSVIVTAHDETVVCGPTMASADLAIAEAERAGFSVERLILLDAPTEETRSYFVQAAYDHWNHRELDQGDLGRVRNEIIPSCQGRWIAFLDADDLFSENWLAEGAACLSRAERAGERVIVHPELNWQFDGGSSVLVNTGQDEPYFAPQYLYIAHYYDSLCLTPKDAHLETPYVSRDIPNGLSFQDWQFTIETMAKGWKHVTARDTIIFKRRRDSSLVTQSSARKSIVRALESMSIERIGELGRGAGNAA